MLARMVRAERMGDPRRATYTVDEAARVLGISRTAAYQAAQRGELPGVRKIGGRMIVSRAELERWLGVQQDERERDE